MDQLPALQCPRNQLLRQRRLDELGRSHWVNEFLEGEDRYSLVGLASHISRPHPYRLYQGRSGKGNCNPQPPSGYPPKLEHSDVEKEE
ncbi:hypothetical protein TNCV_4269891 [Trichonephila clavipes]|nr:hypothetical protein TNCV_4269891 [Trichonephila clavipes]